MKKCITQPFGSKFKHRPPCDGNGWTEEEVRLFRAVRAALAVAVVDRPGRGEVGWDEGGKLPSAELMEPP